MKAPLLLGLLVTTVALAALAASLALADEDGTKRKELRGLREAPNHPVRSIPLRHGFPDHPTGLSGSQTTANCANVDLTSAISGVVAIGTQDNGICDNADLDTIVRNGATHVFQAGGGDAAWTHTDVSDPSNPVLLAQITLDGGNYTPDLKTFKQGPNDYIVLGMERFELPAVCGVIIVRVNDPANPVLESQFIGNDWCDTHNVFVEDNIPTGDGRYIYATADATDDLRVLDISGEFAGSDGISSSVGKPVEIGRYTSPTANGSNYVHDVTVINHTGPAGRRVYLAYWDTGLVILNAGDVTPGTSATPIVGPNQLDPANFLAHHAFASQDGTLVFIQDEFLSANGDQPVQMWDVSDPANPVHVDGLTLGSDVPANPAHNLEIRFDIAPNRLYVAMYKLGLQAWDFTTAGFDHGANPAPRTAVQYHQAQTEVTDGPYDGAWAVRLENITVDGVTNLYIFQSDRFFGLIADCVGCAPVVAITSPADGSVFNSGTEILFQASAIDSVDGDISASIIWTSDIQAGSGTGANLSTTALIDGVHIITASATGSAGIAGTDSITITVSNTPPMVSITSPDDGSTFVLGATINFTGMADDAEDGDISASIVWTSDLHPGASAKGASFSTNLLIEGVHTITATVDATSWRTEIYLDFHQSCFGNLNLEKHGCYYMLLITCLEACSDL